MEQTPDIGSLFSDSRFQEVFVYGFVFIFVLLFLFIIAKVMKSGIGNKLKNMETPFAMTPRELDKLKSDAGLTEEEIKRIRQSMARQMVERMQEEDRKKKLAGQAEVALRTLEARIEAEGIEKVKQQEVPAAGPPGATALQLPTPPVAPRPALAPHLEPLLSRSEVELEELAAAGFLNETDLRALLEAKRR